MCEVHRIQGHSLELSLMHRVSYRGETNALVYIILDNLAIYMKCLCNMFSVVQPNPSYVKHIC